MADLNEIMKERLTKTFAGETQEVTARRLNTTQGNVSKWKSGSQVPTPDMLLTISKAYKVSVDWLMGVSNEPEIDGLVLEKLMLHHMVQNIILSVQVLFWQFCQPQFCFWYFKNVYIMGYQQRILMI